MKRAIMPMEFPDGLEYGKLVDDIGALLESARKVAARAINTILTDAYLRIGKRIVCFEQSGKNRAKYGENLIRNLSRDLGTRYGRGFDERNLRNMRRFYILYQKRYTVCTKSEKRYTVRSESKKQDAVRPEYEQLGMASSEFHLAWSHYRLLIAIDDDDKREFYERECERSGWSVRQLMRQIDSMLYERSRLSRKRDAVLSRANRENAPVTPEDEIKDPYVLDFLDIKDDHSESELEDALIRHLEDFLLELGVGFAFVGRQKTILVGNQRFRVDLVLYHMGLHCLVLIDLKVGTFSHADAGQMNFYLNYFKDRVANPDDNPPVGIILCAEKDDAVVKYALGGMQNRIFAPKYRLRLPDEKVLRREIIREKERFLERRARLGRGLGKLT